MLFLSRQRKELSTLKVLSPEELAQIEENSKLWDELRHWRSKAKSTRIELKAVVIGIVLLLAIIKFKDFEVYVQAGDSRIYATWSSWWGLVSTTKELKWRRDPMQEDFYKVKRYYCWWAREPDGVWEPCLDLINRVQEDYDYLGIPFPEQETEPP